MATSPLHDAVARLASGRAAMIISGVFLGKAVLSHVARSVGFAKAYPTIFPTADDRVKVRLDTLSIDPSRLQVQLTSSPHAEGAIEINLGSLFFVVALVPTADQNLAFSKITFSIDEVKMPIRSSDTKIHIVRASSIVKAVVSEDSDRNNAIAVSGISEADLLRVEGAVAFTAGNRLVASVFEELPPIDLHELFPFLSLGGPLELREVNENLVVIPATLRIANSACPRGDVTAGVDIVPQHRRRDSDEGRDFSRSWEYWITLPTGNSRRVEQADPLVAVYLPQPTLNEYFGKTTPAVAYRDGDKDSFIGWEIDLTVAVHRVGVAIDPGNMALRISLGLTSWGLAVATIDVPCVGRMDLAQARFQMPYHGTADVEALLRLALDSTGRLLLKVEIEKMQLGGAKVNLQLFSKYLGMAGGEAAVAGFVLDHVIGEQIARAVPNLVLQLIERQLNDKFVVLVDLGCMRKYIDRLPNRPTFSGDSKSVLLGLTYLG